MPVRRFRLTIVRPVQRTARCSTAPCRQRTGSARLRASARRSTDTADRRCAVCKSVRRRASARRGRRCALLESPAAYPRLPAVVAVATPPWHWIDPGPASSPLASARSRPQIETDQHLLFIRHIADQLPQWRRQTFDERRRRDDLIATRERQMCIQVDHFECVAPLEVLFADAPDVFDRAHRLWRRAGHIQTEQVLVCTASCTLCRGLRLPGSHAPTRATRARGRRSRPTSTRSAFDRSPMIRLIGCGNRLTSVGTATIWSPRASWGCFSRSMTSISYLPERCSSQIISRFRRAAAARALCPAMYSLKIHSFGRRRPSVARFRGISLSESEWLPSRRRGLRRPPNRRL